MRRTGTLLCACVAALALAASAAAQAPGEGSADGTGLFSRASPSVMLLTSYDAHGTPLRQGSGFVVDSAGTLVTANAIVADAAIVEVKAPDGSSHAATAVLASDPESDVALLKMEGGSAYPALPIADGDPPDEGTAVHVVRTGVQLHNALFPAACSAAHPCPRPAP